MDTRLLEYFVTVAAEESVTEAAHALFVAQSTVSAGLRNLERELGVTLFDRSTRSVRITEAGESLLPQARAVLDGMECLRAEAGQSAEGMRGRLVLGTFTAMEQMNNLPLVLSEFRSRYPGIDITLCASHFGSTGLSEDLAKGRLDIAFCALPAAPEMDTVELASAPYIALVPPDHPLADRESVSLAELASSDWVDVVPGYGNRVQVERSLAERGLTRHVRAEVSGVPGLPAYVAAGLGVAVIPDIVDVSGCVMLNLVDAIPRWRLSLAMRRGSQDRPPIRALIDAFKDHFRLRGGVNPSPVAVGGAAAIVHA